MAIFKPGQRARFVRPIKMLDRCGWEGIVVERCFIHRGSMLADGPALDDYTLIFRFDDGVMCFTNDDRLEPIQPERNSIVSWESLPIDPRKIGETA